MGAKQKSLDMEEGERSQGTHSPNSSRFGCVRLLARFSLQVVVVVKVVAERQKGSEHGKAGKSGC